MTIAASFPEYHHQAVRVEYNEPRLIRHQIRGGAALTRVIEGRPQVA